jgi:hypothetical protein
MDLRVSQLNRFVGSHISLSPGFKRGRSGFPGFVRGSWISMSSTCSRVAVGLGDKEYYFWMISTLAEEYGFC